MPRGLTSPEVVIRIAIRAAIDSMPSLRTDEICELFHVSIRTVVQARHRSVLEWINILVFAPKSKSQRENIHFKRTDPE